MKKTHIFLIIIIAVAIGVIVSAAGDASQYVAFKEAYQMAKEGEKGEVHVVGSLKKDTQGNIEGLFYNPVQDPNYFTFILIDQHKQAQQVVYHKPKPQDFEHAEQIVIVGKMEKDVFKASNILMKCPSKYEADGKALKETKI